jgi:hypothetical protein
LPVLRDIPVVLDLAEAELALNRGRPNPALAQGLTTAAQAAERLWRPVLLYDWLELVELNGQAARVRAGESGREAVLQIGPRAGLLAEARLALLAVASIGDDLDQEVHRLQKDGQVWESYCLDSVGVTGLGEVSRKARRMAEAEAAARGWGVGAALAPGSLEGWPVTGQAELLSLVDLASVGLSLNQAGVIVPFKSSSTLIGLGPDYAARRVGSVCEYCQRAATCWRRKGAEY